MKTTRKSLLFTFVISTILIFFTSLSSAQRRGTTTAPDGFCCYKGQVLSATDPQCRKKGVQLYKNKDEALKNCKISKPEEIVKKPKSKRGQGAEAKIKRKPKKVYCCLKGKIKEVFLGECKNKKGTPYRTEKEANDNCGWCCDEKRVFPTNDSCSNKTEKFFTTRFQADQLCRKLPQCCIDGELFTYSKFECNNRKRGTYYHSHRVAKKQCRDERTQLSLSKQKAMVTSQATLRVPGSPGPDPDSLIPLDGDPPQPPDNGELPNLAIINVNVTESSITPEVSISFQVINTGGPVEDTFTVKLYRRGGGSLDFINIFPPMETDGTRDINFTFQSSSSLCLNNIGIRADSNNTVAESDEIGQNWVNDEQDNVWWGELPTLVPGECPNAGVELTLYGSDNPDLAVELSTVPSNPSAIGVSVIQAVIKVENIGEQAPSAETTVNLWLSDHPYTYYGQTLIPWYTEMIPQLDPGDEHIITHTFTIPTVSTMQGAQNSQKIVPGTFRLHAVLNMETLAPGEEAGLGANEAEHIFLYRGNLPDLVVCFKKYNASHHSSQATYPPKVKNIGTVPSGPVNLRFWIEDKGVENYSIPGLDPGEQYNGVQRTEFWPSWKVGGHSFTLWVDNNDDIDEGDEDNNIITGVIFIKNLWADLQGFNSQTQCSNVPGMAAQPSVTTHQPDPSHENQVTADRIQSLKSDGTQPAHPDKARKTRQRTVRQDQYVPGQILVSFDGSLHVAGLIKELAGLYDLNLLETFELKSLQQNIALFHTDNDLENVIDVLEETAGVLSVQQNFIFTTMGEPMSKMQNVSKVLDLDTIHRRYRGRNMRVAVIDTGVDRLHRELRDRVVFHKNYLQNSPYKPELHGTAVAGIIGASINQTGIQGIAPESDLFALRACRQIAPNNPAGECYSSTIIQALDTAVVQRVHVVSLCLGGSSSDHLVSSLIEAGAQKNIIFVAPAGNQVDQKKLVFPASHRDVVAVAGYNGKGEELPNRLVAAQSNVKAPASHVLTTIPNNKYNFLDGTSMASAVVTGLLIIAREKNGLLPRKKIFYSSQRLDKYRTLILNDSTH